MGYPLLSKEARAALEAALEKAVQDGDVTGLRALASSEDHSKLIRDQAAEMARRQKVTLSPRGALQLASIGINVLRGALRESRAREEQHARRIKELELRLVTLEQRPALKYCGVWERRDYSVGNFVTRKGSVWHCRTPASADDAPGSSACWQLAVKRGHDANLKEKAQDV